MFGKKQEAAAIPAASGNAAAVGITRTDLLTAAMIVALAMLGAALIIHHGLTV